MQDDWRDQNSDSENESGGDFDALSAVSSAEHNDDSDFEYDTVRELIEAVTRDTNRVGRMEPMEFLEWACGLPITPEPIALPSVLFECADEIRKLSKAQLHNRRRAALQHWQQRKAMTAAAWKVFSPPVWTQMHQHKCVAQERYEKLPWNIQSVLGPEKNLILLAEMLAAAKAVDEHLVRDLEEGMRALLVVRECPKPGPA